MDVSVLLTVLPPFSWSPWLLHDPVCPLYPKASFQRPPRTLPVCLNKAKIIYQYLFNFLFFGVSEDPIPSQSKLFPALHAPDQQLSKYMILKSWFGEITFLLFHCWFVWLEVIFSLLFIILAHLLTQKNNLWDSG